MNWLFFFLAMIFSWIATDVAQASGDIDETAYQHLDYALNIASQAAAQQVNFSSVSTGDIVFDQSGAKQTFDQLLASNMNLNTSTLVPNQGSIYTSSPTIQVMQFLDYSNTSFPYHYVNNQWGINTWIYSPSIVFVVQEQAPKAFVSSPSFTMTWPAVVSYEGNA